MIGTIQRFLFILSLAIIGFGFFSGNEPTVIIAKEHPFSPVSIDAADSLLATMTLDEKIAQFFVLKTVEKGALPPCGYVLSLDEMSEVEPSASASALAPILGIDFIHDTKSKTLLDLPTPSQLAATGDERLISEYGFLLGKHLSQYRTDFIIGPSLDVEYNNSNPITLENSFSSEEQNVSTSANSLISGLRNAGLLCVAGSFPGIGNSDRAYEHAPAILYSHQAELNHTDLVPFKSVINSGAQSIIMSNAHVPAIDSSFRSMASTSPKVNSLLRDQMGFNGLIWTDLSNEQLSKDYSSSVTSSFMAGNDIIIVEKDLDEHIKEIKSLVEEEWISVQDINERCKKVIQSKIWIKRAKRLARIDSDLNDREFKLKQRKIIEKSFTLLANKENFLPIQRLDTLNIALIKIGDLPNAKLAYLANRYAPVATFNFSHNSIESDFISFLAEADRYNVVMIIAEESKEPLSRKRFGMSTHCESVIERIAPQFRTCLVWNGNQKALRHVSDNAGLDVVISGHRSLRWSDDLSIQALFAGRAISGTLKRKIDETFTKKSVVFVDKTRLGYGMPEEVGLQLSDIEKVRNIAKKGISEMAYPGCQVWFAKDGIVVMDEGFGHHRYDGETEVTQETIYDLASITKIAGSAAGMMKLTDQNKFNLDRNLCDYLNEWVDTTEYANMNLRAIFAHQAGLTPFIPFYSNTLVKGNPRYDIYSAAASDHYPIKVARELYITADYPDKMFSQIITHPIREEKKYKYSDVGYYFALRIIEKQSGKKMNAFLDSTFYQPLGLTTMGYNPLTRFDKDRIAPTEYDKYFRKQLVHGYVHDPGAAMLGGVGGHAGLFSNANDLGKLMQMYLNEGEYGYEDYLQPETLKDFIRCQFCDNDNRRGATFDKPLRNGASGPSCGCTHLEAFGHQGFTGTVTWADPSEQAVYVFLSNRVYPKADNRKLLELNIRTDIQEAFYEGIQRNKEIAAEE